MIEFNALPAKAQEYLNKLSLLVADVVPVETKTWRFATSGLQPHTDPPRIIIEVSDWAGKGFAYLYTIRLVTSTIHLSKIRDAFLEAKAARKNGRAYPRLNNESTCFYVGSSQKVQQRLKEHMGYGAKDTYALQLAYWANNLSIELEFECAKYRSGLDSQVYQALEDTLWDEVSPMFGRKGKR